MSDTYNRYYRDHLENHIGSERNYILEENCPYCKRTRRWLYYSNFRARSQALRSQAVRRQAVRRQARSQAVRSQARSQAIRRQAIRRQAIRRQEARPQAIRRQEARLREARPREARLQAIRPREVRLPEIRPQATRPPLNYVIEDTEQHLSNLIHVETRRNIRINDIIGDYNVRRNRNIPLVTVFNPATPIGMNSYDTLSRLQPVEVMTTLQEINDNSKVDIMTSNDEMLCVICQINIEHNEVIRRIKCSHYFHIACIDKWLENHKTCPICKHDFS